MTLKSALQDLKQTTLAAVTGLFGKLAYLASLRQKKEEGYQHWGMSHIYGRETSDKALAIAHGEVVTEVLRTPVHNLVEDLHDSCKPEGVPPQEYVEGLRQEFENLLPGAKKNSPSALHLSSVLVALSALEKNREGATRSTS